MSSVACHSAYGGAGQTASSGARVALVTERLLQWWRFKLVEISTSFNPHLARRTE
jgi:hypothetical protein